ncbi:MAG TPA: hypothetical protein VEJ18_18080 [Planctomycetota bacterium]|nr:hypothetical protein [Planctomycetota bacterium]
MGKTFVEYRGKGFFLHTGHLELLVHLLAQEVDRLPDAPPWLRRLQAHWCEHATSGAIDIVLLFLDEPLTSPERVALVLQVAENVRRSILARTTPFSEEKAVNRFGRAVSLTGDIPKTWAVQGVEALIKLLKGELRPDDGRLTLPKIEFYESLVPPDRAVQDVARLWLALERARFTPEPDEVVFERVSQEPWDSRCPPIRAAWDALTAPDHLPALQRWADLMRANPAAFHAAGAWAKKAVEDSQKRR